MSLLIPPFHFPPQFKWFEALSAYCQSSDYACLRTRVEAPSVEARRLPDVHFESQVRHGDPSGLPTRSAFRTRSGRLRPAVEWVCHAWRMRKSRPAGRSLPRSRSPRPTIRADPDRALANPGPGRVDPALHRPLMLKAVRAPVDHPGDRFSSVGSWP